MNTAYYDPLFSGIEHSRLTVRRIVHGYLWTAAELSNGSVAMNKIMPRLLELSRNDEIKITGPINYFGWYFRLG